jgi:hypothetical protein
MSVDASDSRGEHPAELTIDVAERLVKASALHAQGELSDEEFVALRRQLLDGRAEPDPNGR